MAVVGELCLDLDCFVRVPVEHLAVRELDGDDADLLLRRRNCRRGRRGGSGREGGLFRYGGGGRGGGPLSRPAHGRRQRRRRRRRRRVRQHRRGAERGREEGGGQGGGPSFVRWLPSLDWGQGRGGGGGEGRPRRYPDPLLPSALSGGSSNSGLSLVLVPLPDFPLQSLLLSPSYLLNVNGLLPLFPPGGGGGGGGGRGPLLSFHLLRPIVCLRPLSVDLPPSPPQQVSDGPVRPGEASVLQCHQEAPPLPSSPFLFCTFVHSLLLFLLPLPPLLFPLLLFRRRQNADWDYPLSRLRRPGLGRGRHHRRRRRRRWGWGRGGGGRRGRKGG